MKSSRFVTQSALIAAAYVVLTYISHIFGLASGEVQVRISEALTVLPIFTPAAIPGLFAGCLLSNLLTGCTLWDIVFGSLTTLCAAFITYKIRKFRFLAPLPPIILNVITVPLVLAFVSGTPEIIPYCMLTVGAGQLIACGLLGTALHTALWKYKKQLFG